MKFPTLYENPVAFGLQSVGNVKVNKSGYPTFTDVVLIDQHQQIVGTTGDGKNKGFGGKTDHGHGYTPQAGDVWYIQANTMNNYDEGKVAGVKTMDGRELGYIPRDGGAVANAGTPVAPPANSVPVPAYQPGQPASVPAFAFGNTTAMAPPTTAPASTFTPPAPAAASSSRSEDPRGESIERQSTEKLLVAIMGQFPDKTPQQVFDLGLQVKFLAAKLVDESSKGFPSLQPNTPTPPTPPTPAQPAPETASTAAAQATSQLNAMFGNG